MEISMNSTRENIIEAHNLTCSYGKNEAVKNLSFTVPKGTIYAFLGANGAGKTTTIKTLVNILQPKGGSSSIFGIPSNQIGEKELQRIGYVSETQQMPGGLKIRQLINYCKALYPNWDDEYCEHLLTFFDLPPERKVKELSRGMRIKAALTISLAYHPELLILDEPFSGLDPLMRDDLIDGILEMTKQENWSVFVSSHDIDEIEKLADHIGIIDQGNLLIDESIDSLLSRYKKVSFYHKESQTKTDLPDNWKEFESSSGYCSFIHQDLDPASFETEIQSLFPSVDQVTTDKLSLRDVVKVVLKQQSKNELSLVS